ncbi:MAG: peptidoglycan DD-metalloendopeptidase family protein [Bacteroidales bacterium]|nr:peptidoglycan DD-metalloendopeptidase family protein [Bacteroidales bacterium]
MIFILVYTAQSQKRQDLEKQKQKTESELKLSTQILSETERSKIEGINKILIIKKRISLREQLIQDISNQISNIEQQILEKSELIVKLENEIKLLKEEYAKLIYFAYKNRSNYDKMMFILAASDFNQAYRRIKYIQQYTDYRQKQAALIALKQKELEFEINELKDTKNEKILLLTSKEKEKLQLTSEQERENKEVANLKKREKELKKKIEEYKSSMKRLESEIADLIEKEAEELRRSKGTTAFDEVISSGFKNSRGKLDWPIDRGIIIREFGESNHPVLKGIVINNEGIDIKTTKDEKVKCIYDGTVKRVFAVPGANMAVIIRHGQYLTLYSNLVNVKVKPNEKVKKGQIIGDVYFTKDDDNSSVLHLRIYDEKQVLNPKLWLAKK